MPLLAIPVHSVGIQPGFNERWRLPSNHHAETGCVGIMHFDNVILKQSETAFC